MKLLLNDSEFKYFNNVNVSVNYDAFASAFSFDLFFDSNNPEHKALFRPDRYLDAQIVDNNGKPLVTGYILSSQFKSTQVANAVRISGYSYTGALEDCEIPTSLYPLQVRGMSLYEICKKICLEFGIEVVMDMSVASRAMSPIDKAIAHDNKNIKSFLCDLANTKQILITHTEEGQLLLTEANTSQEPLMSFNKGSKGIEFDFNFDGQKMHNRIEMQRQSSKSNSMAGKATINNPYCNRFRPSVKRQSSGDNVEDVNTSARNALSEELKGMSLKISMEGWYRDNNRLVRPNMLISVHNPDLYIYEPTLFFVESITYKGDSNATMCEMNCYLPEVYNKNSVTNIFDNYDN